MGQQNSLSKNELHNEKNEQKNALNSQLVLSFNELAKGSDVISYDKFKDKFGAFVSSYLWRYLQEDNETTEINVEQFTRCAKSLLGMSTDIYVKIFGTADALLKACFEAANIVETPEDAQFLESLKANMTKNGNSFKNIVQWINVVCPRLCLPIQNKVLDIFYHKSRQNEECQSSQWTKLFSSRQQGISVNRFETNVFQYKGSTISIFRVKVNDVFVIASDEEWKHSVNRYGGPNTLLFRFMPSFEYFNLQVKPIYCNFKLRSSVFGLSVGNYFKVDGEMNDVLDIEVWGCALPDVLDEQQKMKLRMKLQAERNRKVSLPGKWDGNPDKAIMEMAGFQFSNERKHDRPNDTE